MYRILRIIVICWIILMSFSRYVIMTHESTIRLDLPSSIYEPFVQSNQSRSAWSTRGHHQKFIIIIIYIYIYIFMYLNLNTYNKKKIQFYESCLSCSSHGKQSFFSSIGIQYLFAYLFFSYFTDTQNPWMTTFLFSRRRIF